MNSTAILLCVIWICATIAACVTKDASDAFLAALLATVVIGLGYLLLHG